MLPRTLFLSGYLTAISGEDGSFLRGPGIFGRRGRLRGDAAETLAELGVEGEVVACLPASATSCQVLRVTAQIGRRVSHTDLSDALENAMSRAGTEGSAVICAEPGRVLIDGAEVMGSAVGKAAQNFDVDVTAFISDLAILASIEKACAAAGMRLVGVMACEEAFAAALASPAEDGQRVILCDRWYTKLLRLDGTHVAASTTVPIGPGHLADDLGLTFSLKPAKAEECARRLLLGRSHLDEEPMIPVVRARLDEWVSSVADAAVQAGISIDGARLVGIAATPVVTDAFKSVGAHVFGAEKLIARTDPAIFALADGARSRASGAVSRNAAAALRLSSPPGSGFLDWLRRNF